MLLQNDALHYTSASTSAFLTQFYAILIPVYLAIRLRRGLGGRVWISSLLVLAGVAILGGFDWRHLHLGRGEAETLLCSVFFMGQILWLEKKEYATNRPGQISLIMFATQSLIFGVLALILAPNRAALITPWTSPAWVTFAIMLAVFCTLVSYGLMNRWQPKITATEAGLIYCVEPVFSSIMSSFLPAIFSVLAGINYRNETATLTLFIGGGLITVANILIQLKPPVRDIPVGAVSK
jgi:drug/metabolite transporter (DMT)-like permease